MILLVLLLNLQAPPQPPPMLGDAPPSGRSHPQDNDILVHRIAKDGTITHTATFPRAGVATIVSLDANTLLAAHQWFPEDNPEHFDHIAVHFSKDGGVHWTDAAPIQIEGLPEGMRFPFDPTIVRLPDGRLRLYFTMMQGRRFETSTPSIGSAISSDGVSWQFEPGIRFQVEGKATIDCAAAHFGGQWHLLTPILTSRGGGPGAGGPGAYRAVSEDGLGFTRQADLQRLGVGQQWLGCLLATSDELTFYGTAQVKAMSVAGRNANIWTATLQPSGMWIRGKTLQVPGADPGVARLDDGTLVVVTTSGPRPGTPSSTRRPMPRPDANRNADRPGRPKPDRRPDRRLDPPTSHAQVNQHLDELIRSANSLDWKGFSRTFAPGATTELTSTQLGRLQSGQSVEEAFRPQLDPTTARSSTDTSPTWPPLPSRLGDTRVQMHGDTAIVTFRAQNEGQRGWWTMVMTRQDQGWKVQHVHAVIPASAGASDD